MTISPNYDHMKWRFCKALEVLLRNVLERKKNKKKKMHEVRQGKYFLKKIIF